MYKEGGHCVFPLFPAPRLLLDLAGEGKVENSNENEARPVYFAHL